MSEPSTRRLRGLRVVFALVLLQALLVGFSAVRPDTIALVLPWPASPLSARFAGCLYLMGAATSALALAARSVAELRVPLVSVAAVTGGLLLLTLPHLGEFDAAGFPTRWLVSYAADVAVTAAVLLRLRGRDVRPPGRSPAAPVLVGYAAATGVAGLVALLAPGLAVAAWPWSISPILAQVYSVFFLTIALGGLLAARDPRPEAGRIYVTANLVMVVLILTVTAGDLDHFAAGGPTVGWVVAFAAAGAALAAALVRVGPRSTAELRDGR